MCINVCTFILHPMHVSQSGSQWLSLDAWKYYTGIVKIWCSINVRNVRKLQVEPVLTLLASLYLFLQSAELKIWKSSNRLRTIIKKWFGSIMDAPTCMKTTIKLIHRYTLLSFLLTSYIKSFSHKRTAVQIYMIKNVSIPAAWWHLCQTSQLCTSHCDNNKSERQTCQFEKILVTTICVLFLDCNHQGQNSQQISPHHQKKLPWTPTWLIREKPFLLHIPACTWAQSTRQRRGSSIKRGGLSSP